MALTNPVSLPLRDMGGTSAVRVTPLFDFKINNNWAGWPVAAALLAALVLSSQTAAQHKQRHDFNTVSQVVQRRFAASEDYKPGDLITQSQVEAVLDDLARAGWQVPGAEAIVNLALADDSFLIKELSSKPGKKFMRKVAKYPGAYVRLDRLSTISQGHEVVRELINAEGGDVMLDYMSTTSGGRNLGRMMAGAQHGVDLNKPTGRIYTADDLLSVLERAYEQANP